MNHKFKFVLTLFFLVILPIVMGYWIFWYQSGLKLNKISTDVNYIQSYEIDRTSIELPTLKNSLRKAFQAPFDLEYFQFCISNNNKVVWPDNKEDYFGLSVYLWDGNSTSTIQIKPQDNECIVLNKDSISFDTSADYKIIYNKAKQFQNPVKLNFMFDWKVLDPRPVIYNQIVSSFIFMFSWIAICEVFLFAYKTLAESLKKRKVRRKPKNL